MKADRDEIVEDLNRLMAEEVDAFLRYFQMRYRLRGVDRLAAEKLFDEGTRETLEHAEAIAKQKAQKRYVEVSLNLMDVEYLDYADNCFDTVIASFVFCSVPHPRRGLKELHRVCKPGGKVILLEHEISANETLAKIMNQLNPLVLKTVGANINRHTLNSVKSCGFKMVYVNCLGGDVVKLIEAVK